MSCEVSGSCKANDLNKTLNASKPCEHAKRLRSEHWL